MNSNQLHRSTTNYETNSSTETLVFNKNNNQDCNHTQNSNQISAHGDPLIAASRLNHVLRVVILFTMGSALAFVLNVLQMEYKSNLFPSNVLLFLKTTWWVIPFCGFAAVYIGCLYPFFDHKFGECHHNDREWTSIIRCVAIFIGLNHLCAKITFENSFQFLIILIVFCLLFWYWFDKTRYGLVFNIVNALVTIVVAHLLQYFDILKYTEIQMDYLSICLLCLIFSGGVTFGNIGRLVDFYDVHHSSQNTKNHLHSD